MKPKAWRAAIPNKRTKADKPQRQAERLEEKVERRGPEHEVGKQDEPKAKNEAA